MCLEDAGGVKKIIATLFIATCGSIAGESGLRVRRSFSCDPSSIRNAYKTTPGNIAYFSHKLGICLLFCVIATLDQRLLFRALSDLRTWDFGPRNNWCGVTTTQQHIAKY